MSDNNRKIRVAITQGDINGIGSEILLKTLSDVHITEWCTPVIFGSAKVLAYYRKALNLQHVNLFQIRSTAEISDRKINLISCLPEDIRVELGKSSEAAGKASLLSLQAAVEAVKQGAADVLVTNPVNKKNMQGEAFAFPGHTEYLAQEFGGAQPLMLMISDNLKIGTVTGHMPLARVVPTLTTELIVGKLAILHRTLVTDFTILNPKIAVLALNPHAGEEGLLGTEEQEIILPAIRQANDQRIAAFGPFPADGFFGSSASTHFDAVLAMYHDQAMIAFKTLCFGEGVNFTAGLPVVRTSPAHGTAYDLAGKNEASYSSFKQALYAACDIYKRRSSYQACVAGAMKDTFQPRKPHASEESAKNNITE